MGRSPKSSVPPPHAPRGGPTLGLLEALGALCERTPPLPGSELGCCYQSRGGGTTRTPLRGHRLRGQRSAGAGHAHALATSLRDWKQARVGQGVEGRRASGGHCACARRPVRLCERLDLGPPDPRRRRAR